MNNNNLISLFVFLFSVISSEYVFSFSSSMKEMDESDLREISGQGLFVSDMIRGDELTGSNEYSTPFNFYRIGMDGEMQLNMNISKLQLGCGGINDHLSGNAGCDIDIDYASLMGRNGTNPGDPGSAFILDRPYIEFAIKNDDTSTLREVAGIKIGAARADGAITGGRRYTQNGINHENTAFATNCNTASQVGEGVVGCHSGINTVSGFLGSELSLTMDVVGEIDLGILNVGLNATGCIGRTQTTRDDCGTGIDDALFVDLAGTRMQTLGLRAAALKANNLEIDLCGFLCGPLESLAETIGAAVLSELTAQMSTDLRSVHKMTLEDTPDFFLSFQREPIAYPRYSKATPASELQVGDFDACAPGSNYSTARCNSAYAVPANTGWWMNIPTVKLLDVDNDNLVIDEPLTLGNVVEILGAPGLMLEHPEFNLTPGVNCYGSSRFC